MTSKAAFMGNDFDPLGNVVLVGLTGAREVSLDGPLKQAQSGLWEGEGMLFNGRGVQVMASGELVRPPVVMAVNRG